MLWKPLHLAVQFRVLIHKIHKLQESGTPPNTFAIYMQVRNIVDDISVDLQNFATVDRQHPRTAFSHLWVHPNKEVPLIPMYLLRISFRETLGLDQVDSPSLDLLHLRPFIRFTDGTCAVWRVHLHRLESSRQCSHYCHPIPHWHY